MFFFSPTVYSVSNPKVKYYKFVTVHEDPKQDIHCPSLLEVGVQDKCNITAYRQGYNYHVTYNLTNGTSTQSFSAIIPGKINAWNLG